MVVVVVAVQQRQTNTSCSLSSDTVSGNKHCMYQQYEWLARSLARISVPLRSCFSETCTLATMREPRPKARSTHGSSGDHFRLFMHGAA